MKDFYQKLLNYSFWLLGRRDYSESEISKKLKEKIKKLLSTTKTGDEKDTDGIIGKILARLKELNYIDDEKYARQYIKSRCEFNPRGKFLIWQELKRKKITKEIFEKIWNEADISDEELASRIIAQKQRSLSRLQALKRKKKILSLLSSRGIKPSVIYDYLKKIN